jgi:hypothetical protein
VSFTSLAFDLGGTGQSFITNQYFEKVLSPVVLATRPDGTIGSKRQCLILAEVVTFLAREIDQMLDAFAEAFRQGDRRREFPTLNGALSTMDQTVQQIRQSGILNVHKVTEPLRMLDLVGRYHLIADNLEDCSRLIRGLRIERYWGDYAL